MEGWLSQFITGQVSRWARIRRELQPALKNAELSEISMEDGYLNLLLGNSITGQESIVRSQTLIPIDVAVNSYNDEGQG